MHILLTVVSPLHILLVCIMHICTHLMTFIYIPAMLSISCQNVAICTLTVERTRYITTSPIATQVRHDTAFINIWNRWTLINLSCSQLFYQFSQNIPWLTEINTDKHSTDWVTFEVPTIVTVSPAMFSPHPGRQQPAFNYVIILYSYSAKNRIICQS
jgi:hypothetical protein